VKVTTALSLEHGREGGEEQEIAIKGFATQTCVEEI
jgi:hypothetical protein